MSARIWPLLIAFLAAPAVPDPAAAQQASRADSLTLARQYTAWFYTGQFDSLLAHHPAADRGDPAARQGLERSFEMLTSRAGTETAVIEEKFVMRNGRPQYWRTARFSDFSEPILLRWVIDANGEIVGIGMGPLSQAPPVDPPR